MIDVKITQFNVQLYFRNPVLDLDDSSSLDRAFAGDQGFVASPSRPPHASYSSSLSSSPASAGVSHPMQNTVSFFRGGFRIAPVQSNVLPFRILQVMSYPNALQEPDSETIACLRYVSESLRQHLQVDVESDVYAVRVVFHSIVHSRGENSVQKALSKLSRIDAVPTLAGRYAGHKNPMDALQLMSIAGEAAGANGGSDAGSLSQESWNDIRISQFEANSYVVTIFNETGSLARSLEFIQGVSQFVANLVREIEQAAAAESGA